MTTVQEVMYRGWAVCCDVHGILLTTTDRWNADFHAYAHSRAAHRKDAIRAGTLAAYRKVRRPGVSA